MCNVLRCLSNFKGNSDNERYQMANKKIPFKYTRPVEDWLHEKGNPHKTSVFFFVDFNLRSYAPCHVVSLYFCPTRSDDSLLSLLPLNNLKCS